MLAKERKVNTLCVIEAKIKKEGVKMVVKDSDIEMWRKRLGHIGEKGLETLTKKGFLSSFTGMSLKTYVHGLAGKTSGVVDNSIK